MRVEQAGILSFRALFDVMLQLARQHFRVLLMVILGLTAAELIFNWAIPDTGSLLAIMVLEFFVLYHFCEHLLADQLPASQDRSRRYGALFFASVLSVLGILVGFVLLVLPGLYLMARWTLIAPLVIAEQRDGKAALNESWAITSASSGVLISMMLATAAASLVVPVMLFFMTDGMGGMAAYVSEALLSLGANAWSTSTTVMAVAAYRLLRTSRSALSEVFA